MKSKILIQSESDSDIKYKFTAHLGRVFRNVKKIQLINATIANSNYTIEEGLNDTFKFYDQLNNLKTITLQEGFYNINELIGLMTTGLNSLSVGTWTLSYSLQNFRVTIQCSSPFKLTKSSMLYTLGFEPMTSFASSYVGYNTVRLNSNKQIAINLNNVHKDVYNTILRTHHSFVISLKDDGAVINFIDENVLRSQCLEFNNDGVDLNYLDISLERTDINRNYIIDSDWSMLLELEYDD